MMNPNNEDTLLPDGIYETLNISYGDNTNLSRFIQIIDGLVVFPKPNEKSISWSYKIDQHSFFEVNLLIENSMIDVIKNYSKDKEKLSELKIISFEIDNDLNFFIKVNLIWDCNEYHKILFKNMCLCFYIKSKNIVGCYLKDIGTFEYLNTTIQKINIVDYMIPFYKDYILLDYLKGREIIEKAILFKIDYL
ncbi:hypothetical protein M0Q97_11345 [Candidatus Dojkabacteria bacterium]|nr:hypothetical protein [Candidatus Dojkabacteria bacterium]